MMNQFVTLPDIQYLPDSSVDAALDLELRKLLTTCFTKPQDIVFQTRRYFNEPPPHRWIVRNEAGAIVAHAALHEKTIQADSHMYRIGGVAEVCVHPDYRGQGLVKALLAAMHKWMQSRGFIFAVLFGDARFYGSSGYVAAGNLMHDARLDSGATVRKQAAAMVKQLAGQPWPASEVYLPGPTF